MGFAFKTPSGKWQANWREPSGKQRSKTFRTKREADAFIAEMETSKTRGSYVSPHAGRALFRDHAQRWMDTRSNEATTSARDQSVMRTHVLPQWGAWPLGKIDQISVQAWVTELARSLSGWSVARCLQLTSGVMRSAVHNRLISFNPCESVQVPGIRKRDSDERVISRRQLREQVLPAVPVRYRAIVATAGGAGLRWGEAAGLRRDALDLDKRQLVVIRTVVEVSGHTSFKPFPKSAAGRRTVPLPGWLVTLIREHLEQWPVEPSAPVFSNEVGGPLRRTLFRSRIWRPSLVRAGLLGSVVMGDDWCEAQWSDAAGEWHSQRCATYAAAVNEVARRQAAGLRFHDLRHSYATWLVDDGVPPNMVQRVMGHGKSSTTLQLYTRKTDGSDRILRALDDDDEER